MLAPCRNYQLSCVSSKVWLHPKDIKDLHHLHQWPTVLCRWSLYKSQAQLTAFCRWSSYLSYPWLRFTPNFLPTEFLPSPVLQRLTARESAWLSLKRIRLSNVHETFLIHKISDPMNSGWWRTTLRCYGHILCLLTIVDEGMIPPAINSLQTA